MKDFQTKLVLTNKISLIRNLITCVLCHPCLKLL